MKFPFSNRLFALMSLVLLFSMCRKKNNIDRNTAKENYELSPVYKKINKAFGGYYIALPPGYNNSDKKYPLFFFLHGQGQMGNGNEHLVYLLHDGIGKWLKDEKIPASFTVNGKYFSFIIAMPQYSSAPTTEQLMESLDYFVDAYRVDTHQIYLSGLSRGSQIITLAAAEAPHRFAAAVPIAGVFQGAETQERCKQIAEAKLPVWELHNFEDPLANVNDAQQFINYLHDFDSVSLSKITIFDAFGHDAWTTALSPEYREKGKNIYEWMLQFKR